MSNYKVSTSYNKTKIVQDVNFINDNGFAERISTSVLSLQEKGVTDALIKLGWTPPKDYEK